MNTFSDFIWTKIITHSVLFIKDIDKKDKEEFITWQKVKSEFEEAHTKAQMEFEQYGSLARQIERFNKLFSNDYFAVFNKRKNKIQLDNHEQR